MQTCVRSRRCRIQSSASLGKRHNQTVTVIEAKQKFCTEIGDATACRNYDKRSYWVVFDFEVGFTLLKGCVPLARIQADAKHGVRVELDSGAVLERHSPRAPTAVEYIFSRSGADPKLAPIRKKPAKPTMNRPPATAAKS